MTRRFIRVFFRLQSLVTSTTTGLNINARMVSQLMYDMNETVTLDVDVVRAVT